MCVYIFIIYITRLCTVANFVCYDWMDNTEIYLYQYLFSVFLRKFELLYCMDVHLSLYLCVLQWIHNEMKYTKNRWHWINGHCSSWSAATQRSFLNSPSCKSLIHVQHGRQTRSAGTGLIHTYTCSDIFLSFGSRCCSTVALLLRLNVCLFL